MSDGMQCTFVNFSGRTRCHRCQSPQIGEHEILVVISIRLTELDMATFNTAAASKPQFTNSGDSDASLQGPPSQFLLIRGLEPSVGEDVLAKGVTKLYKPSRRQSPPLSTAKKSNAKVASTTGDANLGAKEGSLRRVLLIRDRQGGESWRYGFAEFATIDVSFLNP